MRGLQSNAVVIFPTASVIVQFLLPVPTSTRRRTLSRVPRRLEHVRFPAGDGSVAEAQTATISMLTVAEPSMCATRCSMASSPAGVWPGSD